MLTMKSKQMSYQWSWFKVFNNGVFSHWQVELVATQDEPVVDGVSHQVDAGSHDKSDDAEVDRWARQCPGAALNQLKVAALLLFNYFGYI